MMIVEKKTPKRSWLKAKRTNFLITKNFKTERVITAMEFELTHMGSVPTVLTQSLELIKSWL